MVKAGVPLDDYSQLPFNESIFTKLLKNVMHRDSNINFLFSIPLADLSSNFYGTRTTKSGILLNNLVDQIRLGHSKSHNLSNVSKMKEYDRIISLLDFSSRMQKAEKEPSLSSFAITPVGDRGIDSPLFERPKHSKLTPKAKKTQINKIEKTKLEEVKNLLGNW
jgi:hypothetical protein